MITKEYLRQKQSLPVEAKEVLSLDRIREFYEKNEGNVYVAFSGGKDSTVLLDLVRKLYPHVPAVFNNTGQEFPEIRRFVKSTPNVITLRPRLSFTYVVESHGWPILSKKTACALSYMQKLPDDDPRQEKYASSIAERWHFLKDAPFPISDYCCTALKKSPAAMYERATGRKPILGMMASDSDTRELHYIRRGGCNSYSRTTGSWPLGVWLERDIWAYIKKYNLPYSEIYDMGFYRTGCMFCLFGIHLDCGFRGENRIQTMARTHPVLWNYYVNKKGIREVMDYLNFPVDPF